MSEVQITYDQALTLLDNKTHFAVCYFRTCEGSDLYKRRFTSSKKLRDCLVDNRRFLESLAVVTCKSPYRFSRVSFESIYLAFSQLDLFFDGPI